MKTLLVGRWQPFHKGHLELVKAEAGKGDVIIAICSANRSHSLTNLFTAGERYEMITGALDEGGVGAEIVTIPDTGNHALWVELVRRTCPKFERVVSGNEFVRYLFSERGFEVGEPKFFEKEKYNGTKIRKLMADGGNWKEMVPKGVAKVVERVGRDRLRLAQRDSFSKNE